MLLLIGVWDFFLCLKRVWTILQGGFVWANYSAFDQFHCITLKYTTYPSLINNFTFLLEIYLKYLSALSVYKLFWRCLYFLLLFLLLINLIRTEFTYTNKITIASNFSLTPIVTYILNSFRKKFIPCYTVDSYIPYYGLACLSIFMLTFLVYWDSFNIIFNI